MAKTITRLLPDRIYYIGKIESWLNEMALSGFRLVNLNTRVATFEKSTPANINYCIIELDKYPTEEELEKYRKEYWDIACSVDTPTMVNYIKKGKKLYVFQTTDSVDVRPTLEVFGNRKELHERYKTQKTQHIYYIIVGMTALVAAFFNISEYYILFLPSVLLTVSLLFAVFATLSIFEILRIRRIEIMSKKIGTSGDNNWSDFYPRHKRRSVLKIVCWILVFVNLVYIIYAFANIMTESNLDNVNKFIRLEDIEQIEEENIGTTYGTFAPSVFVPSFYMAEEKGSYIDENGDEIYVNYNITYNRCVFPSAVSLANGNCVIKMGLDNTNGENIIYTYSRMFSRITYISVPTGDGYDVQICLSNEKEMIYIDYTGTKDADELILSVENVLDGRQ